MKLSRMFLTLALAAVLSLGLTSPASAGLLTLEVVRTAGPTLTVVDGDANDSDPLANSIKIAESVWGAAGFFPELNSGTSFEANSSFADPVPPDSRQVTVDTIIQRDSDALGLLEYIIRASQQDFDVPAANSKSASSVSNSAFLNSTGADSTSYQGYADPDNALWGLALTPGLHGPFVSPGGFNINGPLGFDESIPYSMTGVVSVLAGSGVQIETTGIMSVSSVSVVIPEPTTILLFGTGLAAVIFARRRK